MKYTILDEDDAGVSFFRDAAFDLDETHFAPPAAPLLLSEDVPAKNMLALTLPAGWIGVPHPSPCAQVAVIMEGLFRVEAGNGEVRDMGPGSVLWMKDIHGSGHSSRAMDGKPVQMMLVQFPAEG